MEVNKTQFKKYADMRIRAEKAENGKFADMSEKSPTLSPEDTLRLLHELRVNQVELEMQNEELRLAQMKLEASNERYFDLYNLAPFGYITLDQDIRIIEVNLTGELLLGMERCNLVKQPLTNFIASEDQSIFYMYRRQLNVQQMSKVCEMRLVRKNNSCFWAQVKMTVVRDSESGNNVYRVVIIDISENKQAEEMLVTSNEKLLMEIKERNKVTLTLQKSEEHFQQIVERLPVAIFCHNETEIVFANAEAVDLVHQEGGQTFIEKSLIEFLHPEDKEEFIQQFKQVFAGRAQKKSLTVRIVSGRETVIDTELFLTSFTYKGDPVVQITAYNITRRKKIEEEFFKAEKLKSISILAGGIAHDFNNYLTVLLGNISLAMSYKDDPDKLYKYLEHTKRATIQTKDLTSQLFVFTRGGELFKEVIAMEQLIIESTNFALSGSNVSCHFSFSENLPMVEIDKGQITQVMYNIIINAVQAMPAGGAIWIKVKTITIEAEISDTPIILSDGEYVNVTVTDEGSGIPEQSLRRIFDPFFTTKENGSGLGLAGSYTIIKNHNGDIQAESVMGKGTSLSFTIPASTQSCATNIKEADIIYGAGKILVMDDEEAIREVIGQMLTTIGYDVDFTSNGTEAIEKYMEAKRKNRSFDLVIMDMTIRGGMGGKNTIKELLQIDPEVKAIVASGYSKDPVMAYFREYGFKGVIKKPFSIAELSNIIHEVIFADDGQEVFPTFDKQLSL
jgi:two-component system cell cycle sensor histidine kinase/response regulator CckA